MKTFLTYIVVFCLITSFASAQRAGIRGTIKSNDGAALSFATIYVKQKGSGTTANVNGYYEIPLNAGRYEVVYQHLGRRTVVRVFNIQDEFINADITLDPEDIILKEVTVGSNDEDPAYTIMRKAISKANYHRNIVDHYSAKVYIKGSAKLKDYPWLAKKALEKDGVEKNRVYLSESLSEIKFTRPNKFEQKVISVRSDRKEGASPGSYIFGSFYEPEIGGTISPLSPKAFSYYKFEYLGTFKDRDYEVSRIKVIPRSKGDNVVDGVITIVEEWWSIHSLDLHTTKMGIDIFMKVTFAPIEEKVWLPVSHQFKVDDKVMGFEFEAHYLSTVSDYKIKLNPELYVEKMDVVDETTEKALAKEVQKKQEAVKATTKRKKKETVNLQERLASGEEITRKELKTIIKDYEKQERKEMKEPEVIADFTFKEDSTTYKNDSLYWAAVRPIPLTQEEVKGYVKADSVAAIEKAKEAGDTLKQSKHKGFQPWDLIIGDHYKIGKHSNFRIYTPMGNFNTVEGFNGVYKIAIGTVLQDTNKTRLRLMPVARYSFSREKFSGYANLQARNKKYQADLDGGRYIQQYNSDDPILPIVNTFTTLLLEKNLMKIYEHDFVNLKFKRTISSRWTVFTNWSWQDRTYLENTSDYKLVNRSSVEDYSPNEPINVELDETSFPKHQALTGSISLSSQPWMKFRNFNGRKEPVGGSSPIFTVEYKRGFNNLLGSDIDYDFVSAGARYDFEVGARGRINLLLEGGKFFNTGSMYFPDFKHFLGNQTPFITNDPVGSFRLLDYYAFSTADRYFVSNVHYQFRKLLLTNIPVVRLAGIRENVFVNYLATPHSRNYTEIGYSIDGIFRIFRLEAAANFIDGKHQDYGFRIGIASNIAVNFND